MRDIFLHVGPPKTGTSAIQVFLRDNAKLLQALGFHVPLTRDGKGLNHHALVSLLAGLPVPPRQRIPENEIIRDLTEASAHSVLLSSEMTAGILRREEPARRLINALSTTGARIILVMYARNQPQLLNSAYSQNVKAFRFSGSFASFVEPALTGLRLQFDAYKPLTARYGLELRARPYSRQIRENGIVPDYLRTVGVPCHGDFRFPERINESVGPLTVEAAREIMAGLPSEQPALTLLQAKKCKLALEQVVRDFRADDRGYCGLTSETARRIEDTFRVSNDRFAADVWGLSWDEAFPDDIGQPFTPNDFQLTDVPQSQRDAVADIIRVARCTIDEILSNKRLGVRQSWNLLRTSGNWRSRDSNQQL